jgi:cytochrome oxidase Cu insertion factor (SCO1/SenC/PrrC family)
MAAGRAHVARGPWHVVGTTSQIQGVVGVVAWLTLSLPVLGIHAQTLLPPDPGRTIGGLVSFEGFVDEQGRDVANLVGADQRAWIVSPIYTRCPFTCAPITAALKSAVQESGLQPSAYRVVSMSFDPNETGAALRDFRERMQLPDGWLTVRAADPGALERTLTSLDFRTMEMGGGQYAHPNLIAVLTPGMRLSEYIFGVTFSPTQLAAAVEAARRGGARSRGWRGYAFVLSGIGLLVSAVVFFTLLLKRRRA